MSVKFIKFKNFKDVYDFVNITQSIDEDVLVSSKDCLYRVDGKSLLGLFSLDLSKELILETKDYSKFSDYIIS